MKEPKNQDKKTLRKAEKKAKVEKPKKEKAPPREEKARPAAAASVRGSVTFVCSECYEEFLLPSNYSKDMVSCPECLHVGKRPDQDFLRTVNIHKSGEKMAFLAALGTGVCLFAALLYLMYVLTPYSGGKTDKNIILALTGACAVLTVVFLALTIRFEKNRWEVYF